MSAICFTLTVHTPVRLRTDYSFFEIGKDHRYRDEGLLLRLARGHHRPLLAARRSGPLRPRAPPRGQVLRFGLAISGPSLRLMR